MKIDLSDSTIAVIRQNMKPLATVDSTIAALFRDFRSLQETARSLVHQNGDLIAEVRRLTDTVDSLSRQNPPQSTGDILARRLQRVIAREERVIAREERGISRAELDVTNRRFAAVTINGKDWTEGTSWHALLIEVTKQTLARLPVEKLAKAAPRSANIVVANERPHNRRYDYHPELGVSIRRSTAAIVWRVIDELCTAAQIYISILLDDGTCLCTGHLLLEQPPLPLEHPQ